jgi:hypothetical protein
MLLLLPWSSAALKPHADEEYVVIDGWVMRRGDVEPTEPMRRP